MYRVSFAIWLKQFTVHDRAAENSRWMTLALLLGSLTKTYFTFTLITPYRSTLTLTLIEKFTDWLTVSTFGNKQKENFKKKVKRNTDVQSVDDATSGRVNIGLLRFDIHWSFYYDMLLS